MKSDETLLAYWLDELDDDATREVEEHVFECDDCGARLREILQLRAGVRGALRAGVLASVVSTAFIDKLRGDGLRVREYRLEPGGSVACTVGPDDDLAVSYLRAPLGGIRQLDLEIEGAGVSHRSTHIPFEAAANQVALIAPTAFLKTLGVASQRMRLLAVTQESERVVGEYTFNHYPWGTGQDS